MDDSLSGIEETYLLMHVEVAWTLASDMRARTISRTDEHRLLESVGQIADLLGVSSRDVWVDYVESAWCPDCGHGCVCGGAK